MPPLAWLKRGLFLVVLIGLLSAAHKAAERWRLETSLLRADVHALLQQAAGEADAARASGLRAQAERLEASLPALANVHWDRVGWSCLIYALGLLPPGLVLHRCLSAFAVPCPLGRALAAQLLGHAGKYIPGKAMVVVLRVGAVLPHVPRTAVPARRNLTWWSWSRSGRRQTVVPGTHSTGGGMPGSQVSHLPTSEASGRPIGRVSTCVFFETLLMMGVGGGLAGVLLWNSPLPVWVRVFAAAMAIVSLIPVCPPVLRRLIYIIATRRQFKRKKQQFRRKQQSTASVSSRAAASSNAPNDVSDIENTVTAADASPITWRLLAECYLISLISWFCIGLAFALLVAAIPSFEPLPPWTQLTTVATAAISLGMVLGFASLLPGGAGVREYVTLLVLAPIIGQTHALLAVIAARLMFILVEALLASLAAFYLHSLAPAPQA